MRQKTLLNGLQMSSFDMKVKMEKLKKSASKLFFSFFFSKAAGSAHFLSFSVSSKKMQSVAYMTWIF